MRRQELSCALHNCRFRSHIRTIASALQRARDASGSLECKTGRSRAKRRRRRRIALAPIGQMNIRPHTWPVHWPPSGRCLCQVTNPSTVLLGPSPGRSPKWRVGRIAEGKSSRSGRTRSRRSPRRRSVGSRRSMRSRPKAQFAPVDERGATPRRDGTADGIPLRVGGKERGP
jgi:hypothetical protein